MKGLVIFLILIVSIIPAFAVNGDTLTEVATLEHDTVNGQSNSLVKVDSDTFALAYSGDQSDGFISTFTISTDGLTITEVASLEHDTLLGDNNSLVQVDSDTFALAYTGDGNDGFITTFTISADGTTITEVATLEHDIVNGIENSLVKVDSDTFALAYQGEDQDGFITTFTIPASGTPITEVATLEHDIVKTRANSLVQVDSDTYALAYQGGSSTGVITTFTISADGTTITEVATLEHDTSLGEDNSLVKVDSDTFALAYSGEAQDGFISTFTISTDGTTITEVATLEHDTSLGESNSLVKVDSDTYVLAYRGDANDGFITTFTIPVDGSTITEVASLEHDTGNGPHNSIVKVDSDTYALAYTGGSDGGANGIISTFTITESSSSSSSGGDTTAPTLGKSDTGKQVVENGFSYQSNLGQFAVVNVEPVGNTPFDSLDVGVGPGIRGPPGDIPNDVREKLNERGLGKVTKTFDNVNDAINALDNFINRPPTDTQPNAPPTVPPGLPRALENLKQNLDQSRLDPNTHGNPKQATQINNVIDRIAQKIAEIENVLPQDTIIDVSDVKRVTGNIRFLAYDTEYITPDELQIKLNELQALQNELRELLEDQNDNSTNETGSNVMKLKIKEDRGINGIEFIKIDFGIKEKARDRGVASVVYTPHFDPIANSRGIPQQLIKIIDRDNYLNHENLELTWQGVDCIEKENITGERQASNYCVEISLAHEFLQATDYDIIGLTVVDRSGNVAYSYFNHGINVQGESLVPPKTQMIVEQGKPPKHIEITLKDRINDLWQDENQNVYTRNSFGSWLKITHEELHEILGQDQDHHVATGENYNFKPVYDEYVQPDDDIIGVNGIERINQHFDEYAYVQELNAMKVWDGTLIQSELPDSFQTPAYGFILGDNDPRLRINDPALQKDIIKQIERAQKYIDSHYTYHLENFP